ncbi:MAG TPA: hypothetical protein DDW31_03975 [candidate division Zixibacteria bacterium]|nr:hypothetical protein [candidate division Zixibacteria bacterium]
MSSSLVCCCFRSSACTVGLRPCGCWGGSTGWRQAGWSGCRDRGRRGMRRGRKTFSAVWLSQGDQHYPHIVYRRKAELLEMLGEWDRAEAIHRGNLEWLKGHGYRHQAAVSRMNLGWIMNRRGLGREGLTLLEEAEGVLESDGTDYDRCNVHNKIGNVCYRLGDYQRAESHFGRSLEISLKRGDLEQEANALNNLGNVYGDLGDLDRALEHYQKSYEIGERTRDVYNNAKTAGNLGWCYYAKNDLSRAMEWYQRSASVAGQCGDRHLLSVALGNMAAIFIGRGEFQEAERHVDRRLEIAREIGDKRGLSISLSHRGHILREKGELRAAEDSLGQAVSLARELDARYFLSMFLNERAQLLLEMARIDEAVACNEEALAIATEMGVGKLVDDATKLRTRLLSGDAGPLDSEGRRKE